MGGLLRTRVFEVDADLVDSLIPDISRDRGAMPDSKLDTPASITRMVGSPLTSISQTAEIDPDVLAKLLTSGATGPGILVDKQREVTWWPHLASTWGYSRVGEFFGSGGATGTLGFRQHHGIAQLRVEYRVNHSLNTKLRADAEIIWEGAAPPSGRARAFFVPFSHQDGAARYLVIIFTLFSKQSPPEAHEPAATSM